MDVEEKEPVVACARCGEEHSGSSLYTFWNRHRKTFDLVCAACLSSEPQPDLFKSLGLE